MEPTGGRIFSETEWAEVASNLALSRRQTEVVRCIFAGLGDKQIAQQLQIATPTVRTHLSRLFDRLEVQGRCEMMLHIFSHFRAGCFLLDCPRRRLHQQ